MTSMKLLSGFMHIDKAGIQFLSFLVTGHFQVRKGHYGLFIPRCSNYTISDAFPTISDHLSPNGKEKLVTFQLITVFNSKFCLNGIPDLFIRASNST